MKTVKLYELKKIQTNFPKEKILSSIDAYKFIKNFYGDDIEVFESFFILLLNRVKLTIGYAKISQGGTISTVVDKKIIAKYAVDSLADSIILCHNHPSGDVMPSKSDIKETFAIRQALELIDVDVIDSMILSSNSYYSMLDEGKI